MAGDLLDDVVDGSGLADRRLHQTEQCGQEPAVHELAHLLEDRRRYDELVEQAQEAEKVAADMIRFQSVHPEITRLPD